MYPQQKKEDLGKDLGFYYQEKHAGTYLKNKKSRSKRWS